MKTILVLLIAVLFSCGGMAQLSSSCVFESLFTLKEGISKEAVADSIKNIYGLQPLNSRAQDNIIHTGNSNKISKELLIYSTETMECFKGNNSKLYFEFINNRLSKACIQTEFARADYYEMLDNFNALRSILKPRWEHEKEIKSSLDNLVSTGYDYSKAKQAKSKAENLSLQYIHTKPDKGYGIYLLQLSWINNSKKGIETIVY